MIREKVKVEEFERIAKENEFFLWHFVTKDGPRNGAIYSYFDDTYYERPHFLKSMLNEIEIPYFESYLEESIDFVMEQGMKGNLLWNANEHLFLPLMITFNRKRKVTSTHEGHCMCIEGILDMIYATNPQYLTDKN